VLPRFSVIIAVCNGAVTIGRAIESVLAQSYPAHEIIVVDDGSIDDTAEVVGGYGERVRYAYQTNAGVASARNAGARLATGEWLAFLDADDLYYPDRLRWHAEWIAEDPHLDFLTGDQEYRSPEGALLRRSMENTQAGRMLLGRAGPDGRVVMERDEEIAAFVDEHFGDTHTLSVPRAAFLGMGGYPLGFRVCEDVNLLIRLCAASRRIGVMCRPMAIYYIYEHSATRRDPLQSQELTVEALLALRQPLADARRAVKLGWRRALRRSRLNLAYVLLRRGHRSKAIRAVLPTLASGRIVDGLRDIASVLRGL